MKNRYFLFIPVLLLIARSEVLLALEGIPMPYGMQSWVVTENAMHNGLPVGIEKFTYPGTPEELGQYYAEQWRLPVAEGKPGFIVEKLSQWTVVSRLEEGILKVVQIGGVSANQTEGFISVADLNRSEPVDSTTILPTPSGTETISVTEAVDNGRKSTSIVLKNNLSVMKNTEFFQSYLSDRGWRLDHAEQLDTMSLIYLSGGNSKLGLTINRDPYGNSLIFANLVLAAGD